LFSIVKEGLVLWCGLKNNKKNTLILKSFFLNFRTKEERTKPHYSTPGSEVSEYALMLVFLLSLFLFLRAPTASETRETPS